MQKWKRICRLRTLQKRRILKNEAGITLVELLAAIAILGIVIALVGSVHIFGQRQFRSQTESANQANDLSHALTVMSTDLRRYAADQVTVENNVISVENNEYKKVGSQLKLNDSVLIDYVSNFIAEPVDDEGVFIKISVESTAAGVEAKYYQTTIYFRGAKPPVSPESEDGGG